MSPVVAYQLRIRARCSDEEARLSVGTRCDGARAVRAGMYPDASRFMGAARLVVLVRQRV